MWGISPSDNNAQINAYKAAYGIGNPCAGTQGGGPAAIDIVNSGQPFIGYPTYIVICPDKTVYYDVCWPPSVTCFDPYFAQCAPAITAAFTSEVDEVCVGGSVQFTDESIGGITSWSWTFEAGMPSTSNLQNPVVFYNFPGQFDVSLTVSNGSAYNTVSVPNAITSYPPPQVELAAFDPVCLQSPSFELFGGFPEGGTYSGPGVENGMFNPTLAGIGNHTITYTYIDLHGCVNDANAMIEVSPCPGITENQGHNLKIYPNPATDEINLSLDYSGKLTIKIVNVLGVCLLEKQFTASSTFSQNLSLAGFADGLYFIIVNSDDKTYIEKLRLTGR